MTIILPKRIGALYERAAAELQLLYHEAPSPMELALLTLDRIEVRELVDEVRGWNEMTRQLKPLERKF